MNQLLADRNERFFNQIRVGLGLDLVLERRGGLG